MSSETIQALVASQMSPPTADFLAPLSFAAAGGNTNLTGPASAQPGSFDQMVAQGLEQVNSQLMAGQTDLQQLALGDTQNLHQIMIRLEESRMSFQLLMQVRNRLLESYQDVMKMQV